MIETVIDLQRGCGWRKPGGLYLVSAGLGQECPMLPLPLTACAVCGGGIHPSRGWTWIQPAGLWRLGPHSALVHDMLCPLALPEKFKDGRAGLIWVGGKYYRSPLDFTREAERQGISRRIAQLPRGLVLGETWVLLAHRQAIPTFWNPTPEYPEPRFKGDAGVFHLFRPSRVEYVVKGTETTEQLEKLVKRGITPVEVRRAFENAVLPLGDEPHAPVD